VISGRAGSWSYRKQDGRARKGDKVKAIEWLEKAIRAGFLDREFIRADKDFDLLRNEETLKRLLADDKLFASQEKEKK